MLLSAVFRSKARMRTSPACCAGIFTPRREIIHCRLAMLGFASLLFLETKSGVVFF